MCNHMPTSQCNRSERGKKHGLEAHLQRPTCFLKQYKVSLGKERSRKEKQT